jgi:hypothetical protein
VSGFHLKRVVQQEFKKEGILKTASSSISMNEINETDVNPEFDLVVGFASDNLNSPVALGTLVTRHFSTHIYFMVPTKKLGGIENPNGNSLVTSQIIIMIWYMFRTRIPGRVCRLLKSTLDRNGNVIRYVELPVIDGCDLIRKKMSDMTERLRNSNLSSILEYWEVDTSKEQIDESISGNAEQIDESCLPSDYVDTREFVEDDDDDEEDEEDDDDDDEEDEEDDDDDDEEDDDDDDDDDGDDGDDDDDDDYLIRRMTR